MAGTTLPALHNAWISQLLGGPIPDEPRATCGDCAMVRRPGVDYLAEEIHYQPHLKCCTYYPDLPNFTVGRILGDPTCPGRSAIRARIAHGARVTPLGIACPPFHDEVTRASARERHGQDDALRCGFLTVAGQCSIWSHREATCASYYCKFQRGKRGHDFWRQLQRLLFLVEQQLSLHCALELDIGAYTIDNLIGLDDRKQLDIWDALEPVPSAYRQRFWGHWTDSELRFYACAAELVGSLDWPEIVTICGPTVRAQAIAVEVAYQELRDLELPERLCPGDWVVSEAGPIRRVLGYSQVDALVLPVEVIEALARFDGRSTAEVLTSAAVDVPALDEAMVRTLVDFAILLPD